MQNTSKNDKPPKWFRSLQIGIGIISLILSVIAILLGYPALELSTIITILSIVLLFIGVERVVTGWMLIRLYAKSSQSKKALSRTKKLSLTNMGLGILALVFAGIAFVSPATVSTIPLLLFSISISVMFNGWGRIIQGALARQQQKGFRILSICLGLLATGAAIFVGNAELFGIKFPIIILFGVLIIHGAALILIASVGKLSLEQVLKK
ncbi:MAG TPA: hypothetical protein VE130_02945 [Nitrososphaeraceae archaeon]|nr:hypothetical protein [Nitrososphaeraceae archaeon]